MSTTGPACGHSACSQNYIDNGDARCVVMQARIERLEGALSALLERGEYDRDGDFAIYQTAAEAAAALTAEEDGDHDFLPIAEIRNAYAALRDEPVPANPGDQQ